jgi:hypothetical protein
MAFQLSAQGCESASYPGAMGIVTPSALKGLKPPRLNRGSDYAPISGNDSRAVHKRVFRYVLKKTAEKINNCRNTGVHLALVHTVFSTKERRSVLT